RDVLRRVMVGRDRRARPSRLPAREDFRRSLSTRRSFKQRLVGEGFAIWRSRLRDHDRLIQWTLHPETRFVEHVRIPRKAPLTRFGTKLQRRAVYALAVSNGGSDWISG